MSAADALHARWTLDAGEHENVVFLVEGMHCGGCARSIEKAVVAQLFDPALVQERLSALLGFVLCGPVVEGLRRRDGCRAVRHVDNVSRHFPQRNRPRLVPQVPELAGNRVSARELVVFGAEREIVLHDQFATIESAVIARIMALAP